MPRILAAARPRPARRDSPGGALRLSPARPDHDPAVVVHLHRLVASWAASAWSRSATARFSASAPMASTMLWNHYGLSPWLGIPIALALAGVVARGDRLSLLSLPHHRPLLRAGDAGALGGGAPPDRRAARLDRRLARRHAAPGARRQLVFACRPAVRRSGGLVLHHARLLAGGPVGSGGWSIAAWRALPCWRSARRRTPRHRSASTSRGPSSASR